MIRDRRLYFVEHRLRLPIAQLQNNLEARFQVSPGHSQTQNAAVFSPEQGLSGERSSVLGRPGTRFVPETVTSVPGHDGGCRYRQSVIAITGWWSASLGVKKLGGRLTAMEFPKEHNGEAEAAHCAVYFAKILYSMM